MQVEYYHPEISMPRAFLISAFAFFAALIAGCTGVPEGLTPVTGFHLERYLGRWYEIARLDHGFERGLVDVTADYRRRPDGRVDVVNRGYDAKAGRWKEANGVARFAGAPDVGSLEVTFFGPFWGGYNILVLDPGYRYAMVAGPNRDYLWILAREPRLDPATVSVLVEKARGWGFDTAALIYVPQGTAPPQAAAR
jgi:apolipoprotein D and lipocalin family protein